ncbi:teichoic acid export ATP-binding protein TagH [alpha proteobacterium U9-1i]|nr:teichoic acid export ATP-binding protein TagH [alpha proteobacterium U9-1i]
MTSPNAPAVHFEHVSKIYRLFGSRQEQVLDSMGLTRLLPKSRQPKFGEFHALRDVSFSIQKGERVGVIGRNGAGKTTMLRLITQNFAPTSGNVAIDGTVQALMQLGLGFHPEFTGHENIVASLNYNGLVGAEFEEALHEVTDFVELGDFLHQPVKSYSLGMQARLQFAAATAIRPDILIVDEVLGAGDAYFSAKSAYRMKKLALSGCTLLLVSHATSEILRFCDRAIWMHQGSILMDGAALDVVRVYEAYIEELNFKMRKQTEALWAEVDAKREALHEKAEGAAAPVVAQEAASPAVAKAPQEDDEQTESAGAALPKWQQSLFAAMLDDEGETNLEGLERWPGERGLKIERVRILDKRNRLTDKITSGDPVTFEFGIVAEHAGDFRFRLSILFMTPEGIGVSRNFSPYYEHNFADGEVIRLRLHMAECLFTGGEYVFGMGLFKHYDMIDGASAVRYDLLSRSFRLRVEGKLVFDPGLFHQPGEWVAASSPPNVALLEACAK